jgi:hypothetical protein
MANKKIPIRYTSKDFNEIKSDLVEYARRYYPETYKDFNQASFGSLMLDTVAYAGDVLSFYLDYQTNESFLDTAVEYDNIVRVGRQLGYKHAENSVSTGVATLYVIIPANDTGLGPNMNYLPILKRGSTLTSKNGNTYVLDEDVRFDNPNSDTVVARVNNSTGVPTSYAVKNYGKVVSGEFSRENIILGQFQKFRKVKLASTRISEIISVFDSEGHEYFQVDHLTQNVVYKSVTNYGDDNTTVPTILKPFVVPRRFTLEKIDGKFYLQFGYGSDSELNTSSIAEPSELVLKMHSRNYITDSTFDPAKLLDTDKFGVAPANTTLTVSYRANSRENTNAAIGALNRVSSAVLDFADPTLVSSKVRNQIKSSFEASNEEAIVGSVTGISKEEYRMRAIDHFATQNRAVTLQDFEAIAYGMPSSLGAVKRVRVLRDPDSFKRNLNMYVLAENDFSLLTIPSSTLKENLKMWLNKYKMIHDTIDILDGKVVNFGIKFSAISHPDVNKYKVLSDAQRALAVEFRHPKYMGEPVYVTDVYNILNKRVPGIVDVKNVEIVPKTGGLYSDYGFDFAENLSADGRYLMVPENVAMELKFANSDIRGTIE